MNPFLDTLGGSPDFTTPYFLNMLGQKRSKQCNVQNLILDHAYS